jgi:S-formylglutathione hydrolase FrmB
MRKNTFFIRLALLVCSALLSFVANAQMPNASALAVVEMKRVQDVKFQSKSLQREMTYRVILPKDYFKGENRYPILYLLHGLTGHYKSWETHVDWVSYLDRYRLIVVSIEGENSWFVNAAASAGGGSNSKEKWEDYVIKDIIDDVENRFRVNRTESYRAIAGMSAGGYAAINLALKYPLVFKFAGSLSGAVSITRDPELEKALKDFGIAAIFGPPNSESRKANDVFLLAEKAEPAHTSYIYMTCGTEDDTVIANHQFADVLRKRHIAYEMREFPGLHEWSFWSAALPDMLRALARKIPEMEAAHVE